MVKNGIYEVYVRHPDDPRGQALPQPPPLSAQDAQDAPATASSWVTPPHTPQPGAVPVKMPFLFAQCGICMVLLFQQCLFFFSPYVPDCYLASLFSP